MAIRRQPRAPSRPKDSASCCPTSTSSPTCGARPSPGYGQADPADVVRVMKPFLVGARQAGVGILIECTQHRRRTKRGHYRSGGPANRVCRSWCRRASTAGTISPRRAPKHDRGRADGPVHRGDPRGHRRHRDQGRVHQNSDRQRLDDRCWRRSSCEPPDAPRARRGPPSPATHRSAATRPGRQPFWSPSIRRFGSSGSTP